MELTTDVRRNQLEIFIDILNFAELARRPTHIMHRTNLNYSQLKKHISWLLEKEFLKELVEPCHVFQTSKKGKNFLEMLNVDYTKNNEFLQDGNASERRTTK